MLLRHGHGVWGQFLGRGAPPPSAELCVHTVLRLVGQARLPELFQDLVQSALQGPWNEAPF